MSERERDERRFLVVAMGAGALNVLDSKNDKDDAISDAFARMKRDTAGDFEYGVFEKVGTVRAETTHVWRDAE